MLVALAVLLTAGSTFASSTCPKMESLSEEDGVKTLRQIFVGAKTKLSSREAAKVLKAARIEAKRIEVTAPKNLNEAIALLADGSEGGDISLSILRHEGTIYTSVISYPGGNPYGIVFKGLRPVMQVSDSDLDCIAKN